MGIDSAPRVLTAAPRRLRLRKLLRLAAHATYIGIVLGLIAFNGFWLARDFWPLPSMRAMQTAVSQERFAEVEAALREHLRRSPNDGEARMLLARGLASRNDLEGCARVLHDVPVWWPRKREALFLEGRAFMGAGWASKAEQAWLACIASDPLHPTPPAMFKAATEGLLDLYSLESRWGDARKVIWAAYDLADPVDRRSILITRFRTELERIDPEKAAPRLRRFVSVDPSDFEARLALAQVEEALGKQAEATRQIQACLGSRPDDPRAWRHWLTILYERKDLSGLAEAAARVPRSCDGDGPIWELRGYARANSGDAAGALAAYREAARLEPYDGEFLYRLSLLESRDGNVTEARKHLERSKVLRAARLELPDALQEFLNVTRGDAPAKVDAETAKRRLVKICRTLGWEREADALEPGPLRSASGM